MLVHSTDYCNSDLNPHKHDIAQWNDIS